MRVDVVRLAVVRNAEEAEILCGLLRTAGIGSSHRPAVSAEEVGGWTEVVVREADLDAARALLPRAGPRY